MNLSMNTVHCYIRDNGKTLLLYRDKKKNDVHQGKWVGIGGHIELGETSNEAILREIKEETGLNPHNLKLKGVITYPNFQGDGTDEVMFLYEASGYDGELINCDEGELKWFTDDEIESLNMWKGDRLFFEWMKQDKFFIAKIRYSGEDVAEAFVSFN